MKGLFELTADLQDKPVEEVYAEWHCFHIGFGEAVCLGSHSKVGIGVSDIALEDLEDEYHWYQAGRATGVFAWVGIITLWGLLWKSKSA